MDKIKMFNESNEYTQLKEFICDSEENLISTDLYLNYVGGPPPLKQKYDIRLEQILNQLCKCILFENDDKYKANALRFIYFEEPLGYIYSLPENNIENIEKFCNGWQIDQIKLITSMRELCYHYWKKFLVSDLVQVEPIDNKYTYVYDLIKKTSEDYLSIQINENNISKIPQSILSTEPNPIKPIKNEDVKVIKISSLVYKLAFCSYAIRLHVESYIYESEVNQVAKKEATLLNRLFNTIENPYNKLSEFSGFTNTNNTNKQESPIKIWAKKNNNNKSTHYFVSIHASLLSKDEFDYSEDSSNEFNNYHRFYSIFISILSELEVSIFY